jgi:hypothetical protein
MRYKAVQHFQRRVASMDSGMTCPQQAEGGRGRARGDAFRKPFWAVPLLLGLALVGILSRRSQTSSIETFSSPSSLLPISLSPETEPPHPARTSSLALLNSLKTDDRGSIVGVFGVTVDADSDCQHVLLCPPPKPKPVISAPVHYHKEINVVMYSMLELKMLQQIRL